MMNKVVRVSVIVAMLLVGGAKLVSAQYQPIPNFVGIGAGKSFRQAINDRLSGAQPVSSRMVSLPFAQLPAEQDGHLFYCTDCAKTSACTGGGTGALALGQNGTWVCSSGGGASAPLNQLLTATGSYPMGGNKPTGLRGRARMRATRSPTSSRAPASGGTGKLGQFSVNGVINVMAQPYGAKGDGITDDWNAIQTAIYAACAATPPASPPTFQPLSALYFPGTVGTTTATYLISKPLRLTCGPIDVGGAGWETTHFKHNYTGPTWIIEAYGANNLSTANYAPAWQATHAYNTNHVIVDSNGRIEWCSAGGTSGGSAPTWATTIGSATTDGTVTWKVASLSGGQLVTGTGYSYIGTLSVGQPANWPSGYNGTVGLNRARNAKTRMLGTWTAFTVQGFFEETVAQDGTFLGFSTSAPYNTITGVAGNNNPLSIAVSSGTLTLRTVIGGVYTPITTTFTPAAYTIYHVAATYDGTTLRFYAGLPGQTGNLIGSAAASGTWSVPPFSVLALPPGGSWPDPVSSGGSFTGLMDSWELASIARYTGSTYTVPSTKFTADQNTAFLLNFPAQVDGTLTAVEYNSTPVYYPVNGTNFGTYGISKIHMHDMELCDSSSAVGASDGIFAVWATNSIFDRLSCGVADNYGIDLAIDDYETKVADFRVTGGEIGYDFAAADNENDYDNLLVDGPYVAGFFEGAGGGATRRYLTVVERGSEYYPWIFVGTSGTCDFCFFDAEASNSNLIANAYVAASWQPITFNNWQPSTPFGQNISDIEEGPDIGGQPPIINFSTPGNLNPGFASVPMILFDTASYSNTTGSVNSGATTLTITAGGSSGNVNGVCVAGAGVGGTLLCEALPGPVAGLVTNSTVTLPTAASTSVTNGVVTFYSLPISPVTIRDSRFPGTPILISNFLPWVRVDNFGALMNGPGFAGSVRTAKILDPVAPSVAPQGTTGSTTYKYGIVCHDGNGGTTLESPLTTIANGNATLSSSNFNLISYCCLAGSITADVVGRADGNHSIATGQTACGGVNDEGQTNPTYSAPIRNTTGDQTIAGMQLSAGISWPLPATVTNGASFFCPNCDPPANPPVACTSSGAKTGAWVHGVNNQWDCVP